MLPISKLPSIRPTCVLEMSKCLSICVIELFMCVAVRDLEKQAKDSTKMNIYKPQGGREASELHLRKSSISTVVIILKRIKVKTHQCEPELKCGKWTQTSDTSGYQK